MAAAGLVGGSPVVENESATVVDESGVELGIGLVVGVGGKADEGGLEAGFACGNMQKRTLNNMLHFCMVMMSNTDMTSQVHHLLILANAYASYVQYVSTFKR